MHKRLQRLLALSHGRPARADSPEPADLIFVLAGRQDRKVYALELFEKGLAPRIVLSVGRFEIRRFARLDLPVAVDLASSASVVSPPQRHFFVALEGGHSRVQLVPVRKFGTLSEIEALARWLESRPEIQSLLVVSSGAHLPRVELCCRALLPPRLKILLIASQRTPNGLNEMERPWRLAMTEMLKRSVYRAVLAVRWSALGRKDFK